MCFNPELSVPTKWEQSSPSLRQARGRRGLPGVGKGRGIAGAKRLRFEKVIAQEKQSGVKTAGRMKVIGQGPQEGGMGGSQSKSARAAPLKARPPPHTHTTR